MKKIDHLCHEPTIAVMQDMKDIIYAVCESCGSPDWKFLPAYRSQGLQECPVRVLICKSAICKSALVCMYFFRPYGALQARAVTD